MTFAYSPPPGGGSIAGDEFAAQTVAMLKAAAAQRKGAARPSDVQVGEAWLYDAVSPWVLNLWDGTNDIPMLTVDPAAHALVFAGLGIGDTVQAHSDVLDLLAAVTPVSGKVPYFTGSPVSVALASLGAFGLTLLSKASGSEVLDALGVSAFARTLLDDADAAAVRATLGVNRFLGGAFKNINSSTSLTSADAGKLMFMYNNAQVAMPDVATCQGGDLFTFYAHTAFTLGSGSTDIYYNGDTVTSISLAAGQTITIYCNQGVNWIVSAASGASSGVKMLTFTRDLSSASGNVDYTGAGFQPSVALVIVGYADYWSVGISDGTHQAMIFNYDTANPRFDNNYSIGVYPATTAAQAGVISMLSDGIRIGWTKFGSLSGTAYGYVLCWK